MVYAEVIGDPIAHSRSPAIHRHWLRAAGADGDFRATRVEPPELRAFVGRRRQDPSWRGCSVTSPHKEAILPLLDGVTDAAARIGAVNCVFREADRILGTNTDPDGLARALTGLRLEGRKVVLIGGGGAARAALAYLESAHPADIVLLVRDPRRAEPLLRDGRRSAALEAAADELADAGLVVNASPLGMTGDAPMPASILRALAAAPDASVMDMVYEPRETALLAAARKLGLPAIDGLAMLIGQARQAFQLFFGVEPPAEDDGLRARIERDAD